MVSVIIPCYSSKETQAQVGEELWYTIASAVSDLETSGIEYEIVAVMNGDFPMTAGLMHSEGTVKSVFCGAHINSPQAARNEGLRHTKGEILFFLDAHVLLPPGFFKQILNDMEESGADFMGTPHKFLGRTFYGCKVAWEEYLWAHEVYYVPPIGEGKLWKSAIHPHGAFAVKRSSFEKAGRYWSGLKGFGGEETQLCFKFWMMGLTCWATPRTYHWHWLAPGGRRTFLAFRHPDFVTNFLMIAAAYGDEKQVARSHDSMEMVHWGNIDLFPAAIQLVTNSEEVKREREFIQKNAAIKSIEELREFFNANSVLN